MKRRTSCGITLLLVFGLTAAFSQETEKVVRKLLTDQVAAWNAGDIEGFMKGYWDSDSMVFVSGGTRTHGYRDVLARYKRTYDSREKMGRLEFKELQFRTVSPTLVIATGVWKLYRSNDQPWGRFTLLVEQKAEGWRIIYDHTSSAN